METLGSVFGSPLRRADSDMERALRRERGGPGDSESQVEEQQGWRHVAARRDVMSRLGNCLHRQRPCNGRRYRRAQRRPQIARIGCRSLIRSPRIGRTVGVILALVQVARDRLRCMSVRVSEQQALVGGECDLRKYEKPRHAAPEEAPRRSDIRAEVPICHWSKSKNGRHDSRDGHQVRMRNLRNDPASSCDECSAQRHVVGAAAAHAVRSLRLWNRLAALTHSSRTSPAPSSAAVHCRPPTPNSDSSPAPRSVATAAARTPDRARRRRWARRARCR